MATVNHLCSAFHSMLLKQQADSRNTVVWRGKASDHPALMQLKQHARREGRLAEEDGSRDLLKGTATEELKPGQARARRRKELGRSPTASSRL